MISFIDYYLDRITMYRLILYYLIILLVVGFVFSIFGQLSFTPIELLFSLSVILTACYVTNYVFSRVFEAPTNVESVYISALIIGLIVSPSISLHSFVFYGWISVLSMSSKYIFALGKKHIFNPVAIAAVLVSFGIGQSPSWWVGTTLMAPFVVIGGLLIVKKIRRFDLVVSFFVAAIMTVTLFTISKGSDFISIYDKLILHSSLLFFAFVMVTEPLTTPPTRELRILYGSLMGMLFAPQVHIGSIYSTPELSLVLSNMVSYMVSPKVKLILTLKEKIKLSSTLYDFIFVPSNKVSYQAGQYMEWTLSHPHTDSRGNRRYFTLASSPTEDTLRLGVKFYDEGSSYKKMMENMDSHTQIVASQLAGDFTLPHNTSQKCVFIAGGIGITPFRSMIKYLIDKKEKRDIILLFANKEYEDIVYTDVFEQAEKELGIKTIYTITDTEHIPSGWKGKVGRIDSKMIQEAIPDYKERLFYLSGPHVMVTAYELVLKEMGVPSQQIKIDFFPGFV